MDLPGSCHCSDFNNLPTAKDIQLHDGDDDSGNFVLYFKLKHIINAFKIKAFVQIPASRSHSHFQEKVK